MTPHRHPSASPAARPHVPAGRWHPARTSQWALEFGDGGGMPAPLARARPSAPATSERDVTRWSVIVALAAAMAVGIAVELLPAVSPEAAAVDAAASAVDAAAARLSAAADRMHRITRGDAT